MKKQSGFVMAAALCCLFLACGGGETATDLDGVWKHAVREISPEEGFYLSATDQKLTISGNTYERWTEDGGFPLGGVEQGKIKRSKTEITFSPEARAESAGEEGAPLSAAEKKAGKQAVPYSLSEDGILTLDGTAYRRDWTGEGAVYGGTMTRGRSTQNIRLTIGAYENGKAADSFYMYARRRTPLKLNATLIGSVLELFEDGGGFFVFPDFDPRADTASGYWLNYESAWEVALAKESLEGDWWFTRTTRDGTEETVITLSPEGTYEKTDTGTFTGGTGGWSGERGTFTRTETEITFTPESTGSGGLFNLGDDGAFESLDEAGKAKARYKAAYSLFGDTLTLGRVVYTKRRAEE